ncbi:MAG: MoaD/ThiS family protein [Clostridia bacterium]|nr:MoaD/ThiS family protein [Clostridia bacterium]
MSKVNVKLFGVLRMDTHLAEETIDIAKVSDIFDSLNKRVDAVYAENKKANPELEHPAKLSVKDAIVYINGERCSSKRRALNTGDEVWLLSPASGG